MSDEGMLSNVHYKYNQSIEPKSTAYFEATDHFGFSRHVLKKFRTERLVVVSKSSGSHAISLSWTDFLRISEALLPPVKFSLS